MWDNDTVMEKIVEKRRDFLEIAEGIASCDKRERSLIEKIEIIHRKYKNEYDILIGQLALSQHERHDLIDRLNKKLLEVRNDN